jgi:hypothetical protein
MIILHSEFTSSTIVHIQEISILTENRISWFLHGLTNWPEGFSGFWLSFVCFNVWSFPELPLLFLSFLYSSQVAQSKVNKEPALICPDGIQKSQKMTECRTVCSSWLLSVIYLTSMYFILLLCKSKAIIITTS